MPLVFKPVMDLEAPFELFQPSYGQKSLNHLPFFSPPVAHGFDLLGRVSDQFPIIRVLPTAVEPQSNWEYVGTAAEQANRPFCLPVFGIRNVNVDVRHSEEISFDSRNRNLWIVRASRHLGR